jgi:hypothetical protein
MLYENQRIEGHGWFKGQVISYCDGYYLVRFEDEDEEELSQEYSDDELAEIMSQESELHRKPAAKPLRVTERTRKNVHSDDGYHSDDTTEDSLPLYAVGTKVQKVRKTRFLRRRAYFPLLSTHRLCLLPVF